jgi:hypothetical protein
MSGTILDVFLSARFGDLKPLVEALRREEQKLDPESELRALVYLAVQLLAGEIKPSSQRRSRATELHAKIIERERELRPTVKKWESRVTKIRKELKVGRSTVAQALSRAARFDESFSGMISTMEQALKKIADRSIPDEKRLELANALSDAVTKAGLLIDRIYEKVGLIYPTRTVPRVGANLLKEAIATAEAEPQAPSRSKD